MLDVIWIPSTLAARRPAVGSHRSLYGFSLDYCPEKPANASQDATLVSFLPRLQCLQHLVWPGDITSTSKFAGLEEGGVLETLLLSPGGGRCLASSIRRSHPTSMTLVHCLFRSPGVSPPALFRLKLNRDHVLWEAPPARPSLHA